MTSWQPDRMYDYAVLRGQLLVDLRETPRDQWSSEAFEGAPGGADLVIIVPAGEPCPDWMRCLFNAKSFGTVTIQSSDAETISHWLYGGLDYLRQEGVANGDFWS